MNNIKKLYGKALNKYEKGYIDKSIEICETIMSLDMKNRAAINLKGLLCYFKGDLQSSRALWKLNYEVNDDKVSKKYLQSLKEDENRFSIYIVAINLIEELKVRDALNTLIKCKESDYNRINVDNAIATCYIRLGENEKALSYIDKVLELDIKNEIAIKNKNKIKNKENNFKKILKIGSLVVLVVGIIATIKIVKTHKNNKVAVKQGNSKKIPVKSVKKEVPKKKTVVKKEVKKKEVFPYKNISESLNNKDFNVIYGYINDWKNKKLSINEKSLINKCEDILKEEGPEYFYLNARECSKNDQELDKTIDILEKAYGCGKESYLYDEIIFMLGKAYEDKGNIQNAIKCYTEYYNKYPQEGYAEGVMYKLANIYKDIDINKSKEYGEKLIKNYPNSEYNNSVIKSIINE